MAVGWVSGVKPLLGENTHYVIRPNRESRIHALLRIFLNSCLCYVEGLGVES
jgi:hypothetical protein